MKNRVLTATLMVAFVCGSFLLTTSCAKKQVGVSGGPGGAAETTAEKGGVTVGDTDDDKAREAERRAKLGSMEFKEVLAEFNNESIYFEFDKAELSAGAKAVLKEKVTFLKDHPAYSVRIEGHCDERGTNEYNLALGERRAHAAKKYMMALGIPEDRIITISYGEERPADPRHTPEAWAKNRRDEFQAVKTG